MSDTNRDSLGIIVAALVGFCMGFFFGVAVGEALHKRPSSMAGAEMAKAIKDCERHGLLGRAVESDPYYRILVIRCEPKTP